jgi:hypothetical protein
LDLSSTHLKGGTIASASAPNSPNVHASLREKSSVVPLGSGFDTGSPRMLRTSSSLISQPPTSRRSTVHRRAQSSTTSELARKIPFADPRLMPKGTNI